MNKLENIFKELDELTTIINPEETYTESIMKDRFDLETAIMSCWNIVDDIDKFREKYELNDKEDNYLLGLSTIYQVKFELLFDIFEDLIHTGKCK